MRAEDLIEAWWEGAPLRVVNFHNTPAHRAAEYDRQLSALAERFAPCSEDDLAGFLATGAWPGRPGVVVALYNGYRNNFEVMRPLLERHGLLGWFFVVSGYVDCAPAEQLGYGAAHNLATVEGEYPDGRHALSWDEVRTLDRAGHVIASHTQSHSRVTETNAAALETEIVGPQKDFERELGRSVRAFAWLMGGAYGENPVADSLVNQAGYEFLFSNLKVQRLPALKPVA